MKKAVTGGDGTCTIFNDLPLGRYYIKEIEAPKGYASTDKIVEIDASYGEDATEVLEFEAEFENAPTKTLLSKTDITGEQEVQGATLTVIAEDGNVVEKWVSGKKPYLIERLPVGKYKLREELAPKGYTVASDVDFEVTDTGNVQKVSMKDETTKGKVVIYKVDKETKKPLAGVEFELRDKDGKVLETLKTDKKGYVESKEYAIGNYEKGKFKKSFAYTLTETKAADGYLLDKTTHDIVFEWKDGKEPVIEVMKELTNQKIPTTPKTGDERNPFSWMVLFVLSVTGLGILVVKIRKKKAGKGEA